MKDSVARGFAFGLGGTTQWGTRFDTLVPDNDDPGYASAELPCAEAYGLAMRYVELTAARTDRPVTSVAYELAGTDHATREIFAQLVMRLGPPQEIEREESDSPDTVALYATWAADGASIGLSLYGAPRPSDFGDGVGKLYVSWSDLDAAAAPFLPAWQAVNDAIAAAAPTAGTVEIFTLAYETAANEEGPAWRCLNAPDLLTTPPVIAAALGAERFALWSDAAGQRWHLSTATDTVVLGADGVSRIMAVEMAPARGGGASMLDAGSLSIRDAYRSPSVAKALALLEKIPGLTVERHESSDV